MIQTIQKLEFKTPAIEDAAWAAPMLQQSGMKCCEASFTTIYMWRHYYDNQIARMEDTLFVRSGDVEPFYLLPAGGDLRRNIEFLFSYQRDRDESLILFGADNPLKDKIEGWFPSMFEWEPSPADFDYIYNTEDLALLKGRKFHSKRNHIATFDSQYQWEYQPIDDSNADEVFAMVTQWCRERGNCSDPGLRSERQSIRKMLQNRKALSLRGGLIRVDGRVVAATLGSPINEELFDIHVEKALADYNGAYAVINREFASRELMGKYSFINRENDMGIEGLRRAKRSYRPVQVLEKYLATQISV